MFRKHGSNQPVLLEKNSSDAALLHNSTESNPLSSRVLRRRDRSSSRTLATQLATGDGLKAEYFNGTNFNTLRTSRVDPTVNFDWGNGSPHSSVGSDNFSVRWTGQVMPKYSETYTFHTLSNDGVRLWVNGKQLINNWKDHSVKEDRGSIALKAGERYTIKMEFYEGKGIATAKLLWSSPSQAKGVIPASQLFSSPTSGTTPLPSSSASVIASVDWNTLQGETTELSYGLNAFQGFEPQNINNSAYSNNMKYMNPGVIRFHHARALEDSSTKPGIVDVANKRWDAKKVVSALQSSIKTFGTDQPERMLNIPGFPEWMDANDDGFLDANQFDNYAKFCADLVKIANQDNKLGVKYWEVLNEEDVKYYVDYHSNNGWGALKDPKKPNRLSELTTIYNKAAEAMKQVDPTIQVGGPAIARSDLSPFYVPFIKATVDNLDFFSYHIYVSGSASTSDANVYKATDTIGNYTKRIAEAVQQASPNRAIPIFMDEHNISWTWTTRDVRMTNHKGAVFDALAMIKAIENGAAGTMAWNEKDDIYGKTSNQNALRPSAHLYHLLNENMIGSRATTSTNNSNVKAFAVDGKNDPYKTYVLVNASGSSQTVQTQFNGWAAAQNVVERHNISASGYTQQTIDWNSIVNGQLTLPADSITLLKFVG
jgi:xylan 1,4-beta-xylosidase